MRPDQPHRQAYRWDTVDWSPTGPGGGLAAGQALEVQVRVLPGPPGK